MSKVVAEIREALKPHHVEGFTTMCFPMPTIQQMERLMAEVERLEKTHSEILMLWKVDRTEVERLQEKHNELRRLDEAEDSCEELANALKIVEAELERSKTSAKAWELQAKGYGKAIDGLEAENAKLRTALEYYARLKWFVDDGKYIHKVAEKALAKPSRLSDEIDWEEADAEAAERLGSGII